MKQELQRTRLKRLKLEVAMQKQALLIHGNDQEQMSVRSLMHGALSVGISSHHRHYSWSALPSLKSHSSLFDSQTSRLASSHTSIASRSLFASNGSSTLLLSRQTSVASTSGLSAIGSAFGQDFGFPEEVSIEQSLWDVDPFPSIKLKPPPSVPIEIDTSKLISMKKPRKMNKKADPTALKTMDTSNLE